MTNKDKYKDMDFSDLEEICVDSLTFNKFSHTNRSRNEKYMKCENWDERDWGNALAGEVGELCNMIKKRFRNLKESDRIPNEELGKEIADIICYCDLLAAQLGLELDDIIPKKFNEISDRYDCPVKL
jgi:NTP pyrophosphatase (non-canonical NTP hydrolase)